MHACLSGSRSRLRPHQLRSGQFQQSNQALAVLSLGILDSQCLEPEHGHADAEHLPGAEVAVCQFSIAKIFGKTLHKNDTNLSIPLGRISMNAHFKSKAILALVLAISIAATGCSAQWINIALQDLPVLTQMALNIATLASAFSKQQNTADIAVIQNLSTQASRDLNLLLTLYNEYKANPNASTLAKIQSAVADANQNLPALLESAHISNSLLTVRVTAAINLILTTVNNFAALMPASSAVKARKAVATLPTASDLKRQWNQQVCTSLDVVNGETPQCLMR
jgi:hypothetical protein